MKEFVDRRVLGGFQCVDAVTNGSIADPLNISTDPLTLRLNRSGVYAVWDAPGLHEYTAFDPLLPWPAPASFEVGIQDPRRQYLPRRSNIQVPQPLPADLPSPTPPFTVSSNAAIVYGPQLVTLYRGPAAPVAPNWAVVRASVTSDATPPSRLPWAVLQVLNGTTVLATGVADSNGEVLIPIAGLGLQVSSSPGGPVTEVTTAATVRAWFDPNNLKQAADWTPNPDDILLNLAGPWKTGSAQIQIGPGQTVYVSLTVSM
jgi:hypothetical protein